MPLFIISVRAETFVGSKNSDVYHYPSCSYVDRIKPENRIYFSSPEDAIDHGYRPCKVCNPPLASVPVLPSPTVTPEPTAIPTPKATPLPTVTPTQSPLSAAEESNNALYVAVGLGAVAVAGGAVYLKKRK
jgi:LPXTG-motif cell wall-anchored protein